MVTKKLKDLANVYISSVDKKAFEHELPVKLCNFTDVYYNWQLDNFDSFSFMKATATPDEISQYSLKANDVCITKDSETRDDIGMSCFIEQDLSNTILGYHCALIRPNSKLLDGGYLNCFLKTNTAKKYFSFRASGSGQRYTLSLENIENIEIPYVDLENQRTISRLFRNINEKIKLNNRINDNLLQSLIVLFNRIMTKSLSSNDVKQTKLSNICVFTSGYPFKTENYVKNGIYKLYTIKNVQNGIVESDVDSYLDSIPKDMDPKCLLSFMDILISLTGNVGRSGLVYDDNCLLNQRVLKINAQEDLFSWIYILLQNNSFIKYAVKVATGTSQKNLSPSQVGDFPAIIPSNKYLKEFNDVAQPALRKIALNNKENLYLKKQRDYLLPLLLNGQVTIK